MWGYLYPDTDATGTVRGLATPTPPQAKAQGRYGKGPLETITHPLGRMNAKTVARYLVKSTVNVAKAITQAARGNLEHGSIGKYCAKNIGQY